MQNKILQTVICTEKVYSYQKMSFVKIAFGEIAIWFLFLLFLAGRAAMGSAPLLMTLIFDLFVIILPVLAIILLLSPVVLTTEIVLSKEGVCFKRRFRPITIRKVTDLKVREFRGKEINITAKGLTPEGREARKRIVRKGGGDVEKRWEEFKGDLRKIKSK